MSLTNIVLSTNEDLAALVKFAEARQGAVELANFLHGAAGGARSASLNVNLGTTVASGTFTLDTVIATDAVSINGVSFTCVASGATANQFNKGADDAATAANLAAAINASVTSLVKDVVVAEASSDVVTVKAIQPGLVGNSIAIASADTTIVASGARLTSGSNGVTYTLKLT